MIRMDVQGQLSVTRKLQLLQMPPAKRKRLLGQIVRKVRTASRRRLRGSVNIDGTAWEARKQRGRGKMLKKMGRHMETYYSADLGRVSLPGGIGRTARQHQDGISEIRTAADQVRKYGQPDYSAPASKPLAKALIKAGFKMRRDGKGYKKPSIKQITETMKHGQAGYILRLLLEKEKKQKWEIPLPARSFLGVTEEEINEMVNGVFDQTIRANPR